MGAATTGDDEIFSFTSRFTDNVELKGRRDEEEEETICKSNKNSADFRMRQKHGVFVGVLVNWRMLLLAAVGETAQMNDVWIWRTV